MFFNKKLMENKEVKSIILLINIKFKNLEINQFCKLSTKTV